MAADVVFTAEDPWYTNSGSWHAILEFARGDPDFPLREEYERYVSAPLGIDFTSLPDAKAAKVARWLCGVTGKMLAAGQWQTGLSQAHMRELARRLQSEIQVRIPAGTAPPPP